MKKYNFYSLFLLTILSFSMLFFSCSRSCKKAVLDYIPGFSQNKPIKEEQSVEKEQSAFKNIFFRFKEKDYEGNINVNNSIIYVDLNGENPDESIILEKWELISKYNTFEYELKAKKDDNGIINAIVIEKLELPIISYQVLFQKENKIVNQEEFQKAQKAPFIEKIELKDSQGNTVNVNIEKEKILILNGKKGENYQIIQLILSDFMASAKLNVGDYWKIGEENTIFDENNKTVYTLSVKDATTTPKEVVKKKKLVKKRKIDKAKPQNITQNIEISDKTKENSNYTKQKNKKNKVEVTKNVSTDEMSDFPTALLPEEELPVSKTKKQKNKKNKKNKVEVTKNVSTDEMSGFPTDLPEEELPVSKTKKQKNKKNKVVPEYDFSSDNSLAENATVQNIDTAVLKINKLLSLSLQNENGQIFVGKLDVKNKMLVFEIPSDLKGNFIFKDLQTKKGYSVKGVLLNNKISYNQLMKPSAFTLSNKKSEEIYILKVTHPLDVVLSLKTGTDGFIAAGDLLDTLRLGLQKDTDEDEDAIIADKTKTKTKIKSKLFSGIVNVYLADSLIFSLDNIKVGKKENIISLDSLHQILVGRDNYKKNIRITYTRNGIELGELILQQTQYEIRTGKDLAGVSLDLDGEYTQMNDIIIQNESDEEDLIEDFMTDGGFKPIGGEDNPFMGKYDGQNFKIQNLSIFSTQEYTALFPVLGENATLQNINIILKETGEQLYFAISGNKYTAALVGANNSGIIENCHVKGAAIKGTDIIGGLVAYNAGIIILSSSDVFVQSKSDGLADTGAVGGLVGFNNAGTIDASQSANTVEGNQATFVGGFIGKSVLSIITMSSSTAKVSGMKIVGGFIGSNEEGSISNSTVQSENISGVKYLGGFIGQNTNALIMLCSALANVTGTQSVGGFIGINENSNIIGSFSNGNTRGEKVVGGFIGENILSQIMYSYSMGEVYVNTKHGAEFIGINKKSNIKACFSLSKVSGSGVKKHFIANLKGGKTTDSYYVFAENSRKKAKKNQAVALRNEAELAAKMIELNLNLEPGIELSNTPKDNKPFIMERDEVKLWWEI